MAYTTINKGSSYFNTKLYTGNGTDATSITGVGFSPEFTWIKERSSTSPHKLLDIIRGATKELESNSTAAEAIEATSLQSFDSDGFTVGTNGAVNENAQTYVAWNWLANGAGVSNTAGTISSTVSANTTAGFSIVSYTGNGTNGATIGHGLGVAPKMVIPKCRSDAGDWSCYHASLSASNNIFLNLTQAQSAIVSKDDGGISTTSSTTFTIAQGGISQNNVNGSGRTYIAYCFADVKGYSKFGSYTGNGNANGTFVYTGFKPAFVLIKQSSAAGEFWTLSDNKRVADYNVTDARLFPNATNAEASNGAGNIDFLSNGFKIRNSDSPMNASSATYIYMCFASNPFVSSTLIPTTAR
jgi:hypothetical protein